MLRNVHQYKDGMVWELGGVYEGASASQVNVICAWNELCVTVSTYNIGEVVSLNQMLPR